MKKKTNAFICIVLSFVMCIGLASCNSGQSNIETQVGDISQNDTNNQVGDTSKNEPNEVIHYYDIDADYSIEYKNGGYVINFEDPDLYQSQNQTLATISFSSMNEFVDSVTKGKLTSNQKQIMAGFKRNEDGDILTCDFSRMYVPALPDFGTVSNVEWEGQGYSFGIEFDNGAFGTVICPTEESYKSRYQRDYVDLFDRDNITVTKRETLDDNKEVIYRTTDVSELKNVRYSMSVKGKIITIDKTFLLQTDFPNLLTASATVPLYIKLYCVIDGQYCYVALFDLQEDPTDEWLLEFGLTEFVDNESAEKLETAN